MMTRKALIVLSLSLALASTSACSKRSQQLTSAQKQELSVHVSKEATKPGHPLNVKFGDYLTLIGYDLDADKFTPGKDVGVTWHFRVNKQLAEGTLLFTHLADANDVSRLNLDQAGTLRTIFPASQWQAGTYVRDPQVIRLPDDWNSDKATVYLGFWKDSAQASSEEQRLPVAGGPTDGHRRARVLTLPTGVAAAAPAAVEPPPELTAVRAEGAIKTDGKLDEKSWSKAKTSAVFVNTMNGDAAEPKGTVKPLYDDKNVYVAFDVADDFLKSTFTKNEDHLWEQDCVEIMVDPDGDGKNYIELQVSPANKRFDTSYESRRVPKPFGMMDYDSKLSSGVVTRGKLNDDDVDEGYTAEIAIPWAAFTVGETKVAPAKPGDSFRINFYVMDTRKEGNQRAVGWSAPRVGDFHVPARFGKLTFE